jgi:hypothetical protein
MRKGTDTPKSLDIDDYPAQAGRLATEGRGACVPLLALTDGPTVTRESGVRMGKIGRHRSAWPQGGLEATRGQGIADPRGRKRRPIGQPRRTRSGRARVGRPRPARKGGIAEKSVRISPPDRRSARNPRNPRQDSPKSCAANRSAIGPPSVRHRSATAHGSCVCVSSTRASAAGVLAAALRVGGSPASSLRCGIAARRAGLQPCDTLVHSARPRRQQVLSERVYYLRSMASVVGFRRTGPR